MGDYCELAIAKMMPLYGAVLNVRRKKWFYLVFIWPGLLHDRYATQGQVRNHPQPGFRNLRASLVLYHSKASYLHAVNNIWKSLKRHLPGVPQWDRPCNPTYLPTYPGSAEGPKRRPLMAGVGTGTVCVN
jgi:hypothetical protein